MFEWIKELITQLTSTALILGVIGWVAKSLFNNYLNKNIENYKKKLELIFLSDNLKLKRLIEQQALNIELLYKKIQKTISTAQRVAQPFEPAGIPPINERFNNFSKSATDYLEFYHENKIWFKIELNEKIESFNKEIREIMVQIEVYIVNKADSQGKLDKWHESWNRLTKTTIPELTRDIESEFRQILGVQ